VVSLACIFAFAGGSPQYFVWILPFLLIGGFYSVAAIYNLVLTTFFLLYYMSTWAHVAMPNHNMASFAARREFVWFMPSGDWINAHAAYLTDVMGNYVLPLMHVLIAVYAVVVALRAMQRKTAQRQPFVWYRVYYLFIGSVLTGITVALMVLCANWSTIASHFSIAMRQQDVSYQVQRIGVVVVGIYGHVGYFNVMSLLIALGMVWSVIAIFMLQRKSENGCDW
jgi:hypothetical protein